MSEYILFKLIEELKAPIKKVFTHAVVGTLEELSVMAKEVFIIGLFEKNAVDAFNTVAFTVETFNTDAFADCTFDRELDINVFTQAVVGTLEELSEIDKDEFIFGLFEKNVVPSKVFEAVFDPISSDPLVKLSQIVHVVVELFACILLI